MEIIKNEFGEHLGDTVYAYTLKNDHNISVTALNYGCIITEIFTPDRDGNVENIVLGFDNMDDYRNLSPFFGAIVGRIAGRIGGSQFELNNQTYKITANEGRNHKHGGNVGFDKKIWDVNTHLDQNSVKIEFSLSSPDGEEGYPGNLDIQVTYELTNNNKFIVTYRGKSDQDTILNMTNHSYFNLSGNLKENILQHELKLNSTNILELDDEFIPTGKVLDITDTAFDFRNGRKLMDGTTSDHPQNILASNGYDHPYVLPESGREILLSYDKNGRTMAVDTNQPSVVLYTANKLPGTYSIGDIKVEKYLGVTLETQGYPDAINHPHFPSIVLKKDEEYYSTTTFTFGVK